MAVRTGQPGLVCGCGRKVRMPRSIRKPGRREAACPCGRLLELEFVGECWRVSGVLEPEGSVPVSGFSRDLRRSPDVRRYWFQHALSPSGYLIAHVVFSPSSGVAEVKAADLKAMSFEGVATAT